MFVSDINITLQGCSGHIQTKLILAWGRNAILHGNVIINNIYISAATRIKDEPKMYVSSRLYSYAGNTTFKGIALSTFAYK